MFHIACDVYKECMLMHISCWHLLGFQCSPDLRCPTVLYVVVHNELHEGGWLSDIVTYVLLASALIRYFGADHTDKHPNLVAALVHFV